MIRNAKTAAREKLDGLIRLARFLVPVSFGDAKSLFNQAIEVSNELDDEAIHQIALFDPLSNYAAGTMDVGKGRSVARDLAVVIGDAAVRLSGHEHFPWEDAARALATFDVNVALAATARWEDASLIERTALLPEVLRTALGRGDVSATQAAALAPLMNDVGIELIDRIVEKAPRTDATRSGMLVEELARDELLRFGQGRRPEILQRLSTLVRQGNAVPWLQRLARTTAFHQDDRTPAFVRAVDREKSVPERASVAKGTADPLASIVWNSHRFVDASEITHTVRAVHEAARSVDGYTSTSAVLDRIRGAVALADRAAHLDALSAWAQDEITDDAGTAIAACIDAWHSQSPSVASWCRNRLLNVVIELLPSLSHGLAYGCSPLPALLVRTEATELRLCAALMEGMERHADALGASTVYALVGLTARYCAGGDVARLAERYVSRLRGRIPPAEQDPWDLDDIPRRTDSSLARLLYALMSDVDVRTRWRAAHSLRRLVRLGDEIVVPELVSLYARTTECSFRIPEAPFYWMASRLWLTIALDRIASESPASITSLSRALVDIACDEGFPHLLVRSFAKSAAEKLAAIGLAALDEETQAMLGAANRGPIARRKLGKPHRGDFDRHAHRDREGRRFHFDSMDTLPYWYSRALRVFVDVDETTFLDAAERWIVDRWGVEGEPWRWDTQPRRGRFSDRSWALTGHGHGSMPTLERFHTYLEWHAMWCATGELMRHHAPASSRTDDYDTFENWLRENGLTMPPLWLADLHGSMPLEERLWFAPAGDVGEWIDKVSDDDFLAELQLGDRDGMIVVNSHRETGSRSFREAARVETATVSPDTAGALIRALQTVDDSSSYRIPPAGNDLEIDSPPYRLLGWLIDNYMDAALDERDPLRFGVRAIECRPSSKAMEALGIRFVNEEAKWIATDSGTALLRYDAWSSSPDDDGDRMRYDESIRCAGHRLRIDRDALKRFLDDCGLDLIVEIEITRRDRGYEDYSLRDEKEAQESRFDRLYILRRDGRIDAAEGCIGTWTTPRPRTES